MTPAEIRKEALIYAFEHWHSTLSDDPSVVDSADAYTAGYLAGARRMNEDAVKYLAHYREAYAEDVFTTTDKEMERLNPKFRAAVSARMGRFVLDNCLTDIRALMPAEDEK